MNTVQIIFSVVYIALLISYLFSETSGNFKRRAVNKIAMASMFLIYAVVEFVRPLAGENGMLCVPSIEKCVIIAAFFFAWLGDVLLLWSFMKGGIAFIVSNLLFSVYLIRVIYSNRIPFVRMLPSVIIYVLLIGTVIALYKTKKIDFGKIGGAMVIYLASVTLHGSMSIGVLINVQQTHITLLCCGLILFMISDYFLTTDKFIHPAKWVLRCNSATYFSGLLLACLSMSYT
ncbi:MAG: lysoplasmalogenase [Clostridia bacterium]|nr:lysoplasmalogenase [Clostridia bacterium]